MSRHRCHSFALITFLLALAPFNFQPVSAQEDSSGQSADPVRVTLLQHTLMRMPPPGPAEGEENASILLTRLVAEGLQGRGDVELVGVRFRGEQPSHRPVTGGFVISGMATVLGSKSRADAWVIRPVGGDGEIVGKRTVEGDGNLLTMARQIVGGIVSILEEIGSLPTEAAAPASTTDPAAVPGDVPEEALAAFGEGAVAEIDGRHEEALAAYQHAFELGGEAFYEAQTAVERLAGAES